MEGGGEGTAADFRIDRAGRPWLLEVNANPDIAPDAGLARMGRVAGMDYASMVHAICESALDRARGGSEIERWAVAQRLSGVLRNSDGATLDLFAVGHR